MSVGIVMTKVTILLLTVAFTLGTLLCASMNSDFAIVITIMLFFIILYHNLAHLSLIFRSEILIRETFRRRRARPNFFFNVIGNRADSISNTVALALVFLVTNVIIHGIRFPIW
jgi:membrane-associated HD superfamily phosphohydrolase